MAHSVWVSLSAWGWWRGWPSHFLVLERLDLDHLAGWGWLPGDSVGPWCWRRWPLPFAHLVSAHFALIPSMKACPWELCTLGTLDGSMENVCFSICSVSGTFICASSHHHCHTEQSVQPKAFPGACSFHQPWCFQASWYPPSCFYSCLRSSRLGLRDVGYFFLSFF